MNIVLKVLKNINKKIKNIMFYITKAIIFLVIGLMIATPFVINKTTFQRNNIVSFDKKITVISVEGNVKVKALDTYINTGVSYNKYDNYVKSYKKSSLFKNSMVIELYLLFILLELVCFYFALSNIIKLFDNKEDNEYILYVNKRSFVINVISIYILSFIRRFIFRNTIFSSLNYNMVILYAFSIIMFVIVGRIIDMNKVYLLKEKKYDKSKKID